MVSRYADKKLLDIALFTVPSLLFKVILDKNIKKTYNWTKLIKIVM